MLVWLIYIGAAAAAMNREHLGFDGLVDKLKMPWKATILIVSESAILGFFLVVTIYGFRILGAMEGETLENRIFPINQK